MSTRRTIPVLLASAGIAALGAGPAAARQSDVPLRPDAPAVHATQRQQDLRSPGAADTAPGSAERAAAIPIPTAPAAPATPLVRVDDGGLSTWGYAGLAAGVAAALLGAAYLGARFAGRAPRLRTH